jgi:hypothetical protein
LALRSANRKKNQGRGAVVFDYTLGGVFSLGQHLPNKITFII